LAESFFMNRSRAARYLDSVTITVGGLSFITARVNRSGVGDGDAALIGPLVCDAMFERV
jgi:hypothetical protein